MILIWPEKCLRSEGSSGLMSPKVTEVRVKPDHLRAKEVMFLLENLFKWFAPWGDWESISGSLLPFFSACRQAGGPQG